MIKLHEVFKMFSGSRDSELLPVQEVSRRGEARLWRWQRRRRRRRAQPHFLFHAALFHSWTPLVARSTAEAASQSPLLVCPVTPHHWGQRVLGLPINEPASAPLPPKTPTVEREEGGVAHRLSVETAAMRRGILVPAATLRT